MAEERTLHYVEQLAGGIAHDFNNLLMAIMGHADLLADSCAPGDPRAADIAAIRQAAEHATALTRQLLAFSQQQTIRASVLNLNDIVDQARRILARVAGDEGIELVIVPGTGLRSVKADPAQVEQIILALAVNARDAMPSGGTLTVRTDNVHLDETLALRHGVSAGDYVELSVADSGIGMDPDVQANLFAPFFTTKDRGYGTGLGLAMVHGIVRQSGGHITVESEVSRGSRFAVRFPATLESASPPLGERPRADDRGFETVLLVEDDGAVRALMADVLRRRGYNVLAAADGFQALRIADAHGGAIQLLVTDVVMRKMSGVDVAKAVREMRPDLRVLYVSGYAADPAITTESADHTFLLKPFTPDALARKVRAILTP